MNRRNMFTSRMTCAVLVSKTPSGAFQAHALDFDLLCEAPSREKVIEKLELSVKAYIDFGLSKGWSEDIIYPAPQEYWDKAASNHTTD